MRALAFDLVPDELRPAVADRLVELIRQGRHPPRHRLPGDAATCCRCSPTPGTSTSPTSCCSRTPSRRGWSWSTAAPPRCGSGGTASTPTACRTSRSTTTPRARSSRSCTGTPPGIELVEPALPPLPGPAAAPAAGSRRAEAAHESPYGRIESAWQHRTASAFHLRVVVPAGTKAEVVLPDGTTATVGHGQHAWDAAGLPSAG